MFSSLLVKFLLTIIITILFVLKVQQYYFKTLRKQQVTAVYEKIEIKKITGLKRLIFTAALKTRIHEACLFCSACEAE